MKRFARARPRHTPGTMNKLEQAYAQRLELLKRAGEIQEYHFECIKFKLAPNTFYTPDFMVVAKDGTLEFHETKGFFEDDARVKIKVFASLYPFRVIAVRKEKGEWTIEEISKP